MPSDSPAPSPAPPRHSSCLTSVLALVALIGASTLLLILPGLMGWAFVLGGIAFFGLFAFHYFVWGRWLNLELKDSEQSADDHTK